MSVDFEVERKYKIQNPKSQSYRLTLPSLFFNEYSIEENKEYDIEISSNNGFATINYGISDNSNNISRKLTKSNNTIRIPSSIGDGISLFENTDIHWTSCIENDVRKFNAETTYHIPAIDISNWEVLKKTSLKPIKQSRKSDTGENQKQEHFDIYFNQVEKEMLGWDIETVVEMAIVSIDDKLSLQIQPKSKSSQKLGAKINSSGFKQKDARIYIPRALVRSLGLSNKNFDILYQNQSIILKY